MQGHIPGPPHTQTSKSQPQLDYVTTRKPARGTTTCWQRSRRSQTAEQHRDDHDNQFEICMLIHVKMDKIIRCKFGC